MDVILAMWNDLEPLTRYLVVVVAILMLVRESITPDNDNY